MGFQSRATPTTQEKVLKIFIHIIFFSRGGALEYEIDGGLPTGERKQGTFDVGFRTKKG